MKKYIVIAGLLMLCLVGCSDVTSLVQSIETQVSEIQATETQVGETQDTVSVQETTAEAGEGVAVEVNEDTQDIQETVTFDSPWMGVWESADGLVLIIKAGGGLDMYCYDPSKGGGWQINVTADEIMGNSILSVMADPMCDYYAESALELDGDQLTFTQTFWGEPTEYMGIVFTRTDRTDLSDAWTEYWNK